MTFPGLEMTILKCHDFSRFSMTVRTLINAFGCEDLTNLQERIRLHDDSRWVQACCSLPTGV